MILFPRGINWRTLSSKKSVLYISHLSAPTCVHIRLTKSVSIASGCLQDAAVTPGLPGLLNKVYLHSVTKCCLLYNATSLRNCQCLLISAKKLLIICFLSHFLHKGEILEQNWDIYLYLSIYFYICKYNLKLPLLLTNM